MIAGEEYVLPDFVKDIFVDVMRHRVQPEDASDVEQLLGHVLNQVAVR